MPNEDKKILEYKHGEKSLKALAIIYVDLKYLLEKIHLCQNNLKKFYTERKAKHTSSCCSLFSNCLFDATKNKLNHYRGKNCIERFCEDLRKHVMKIIIYEKKEMIPLTDKKTEFYEKQKACHICKK